MSKFFAGSVVVCGLLFAGSSSAFATTFTLDQSNHFTGLFGTVVVTQAGPNAVDVLVDLNDTIGFVDTGNAAPGNHPDFAWNLAGAPAGVTVTLLQTGGDGWTFYDKHSHPVDMSDSFGSYEYALYCNGSPKCGSGGSDPNFGPLEFLVNLGGITPGSFVANDAGTFFAVDLIDGYPNGPTGLARTTSGRTVTEVPVPEPASLTLLGSGLLALARRRFTRKA